MHRCDSWAKEHNHIFMGAISRRWGGFISVEIEEFKSAVPVAWRGHLATGDEPINYSQRGMWPSVKGIRSSLQSCPVKKPQGLELRAAPARSLVSTLSCQSKNPQATESCPESCEGHWKEILSQGALVWNSSHSQLLDFREFVCKRSWAKILN